MRELPLERSLAGVVVDTGSPVAVEDIATDPRALDVSQVFGWPSLGPAVVVPLRVGRAGGRRAGPGVEPGAGRGATTPWTRRCRPASPSTPPSSCRSSGRARTAQRLAMLEDRDRIGRDLHDVVIQRLFAVGLGLQGDLPGWWTDPDVAVRLDQAVDDLDATIKDIRRSIFALASTDASHDIQAEVTRLVDRAAGTLKFRPTLLFEGPVRTLVSGDLAPDVLAVLGEALSNASRHADAHAVDVLLSAGDDVVLRVADDGRGLDGARPRERAAQHARASRAPRRHVRGGVRPR